MGTPGNQDSRIRRHVEPVDQNKRDRHLVRLRDILQANYDKGEALGTTQNKNSAVTQWCHFTQDLLGISALLPHQHTYRLSPAEKKTRDMVLLMFASALSEPGHIPGVRGHTTAKATTDVISAVDNWHIEHEAMPLRSEEFSRKIRRFVKGRNRIKPHTPRVRTGYSHRHIIEMNRLCKSYKPDQKWFTGKQNFKGVNGRFDPAFVSTITAMRSVAWTNLLRLGEITGKPKEISLTIPNGSEGLTFRNAICS